MLLYAEDDKIEIFKYWIRIEESQNSHHKLYLKNKKCILISNWMITNGPQWVCSISK